MLATVRHSLKKAVGATVAATAAVRPAAAAVAGSRRGIVSASATASAAATPAAKSSLFNARLLSLAVAGSLGVLMAAQMSTHSASAPEEVSKSGLSSKAFTPLKLLRREKYNHNTDIFTFALPNPSAQLDLPVSSFFLTKTKGADGKDIIRQWRHKSPYTPIDISSPGELHLIIKVYEKGLMSKHIHSLKPGDSLEIKGPMPKLAYVPNKWKQVGMIAGGTGISPMLQVMEKILSDPNDKTQVSLVFANTSPQDILLKERLDALAKQHGQRVKVTYVVDKPDASWKGSKGYITRDLLSSSLPQPGVDNFTYVCGPPGFMEHVSGNKNLKDFSQGELKGLLKEMGWTESNVLKF